MKKANTSVNITAKDLEMVTSVLRTLRDKMPFLVTLTPAERQLTRLKSGTVAQAEATLAVAREHRNVLPQTFDFEAFVNDVAAASGLHRCLTELRQLASDLQDTLQTAAAEARKGSRQVRAHLQAAAETTPGLQLAAAGLSRRRARTREPKVVAGPAVAPSPPVVPPPPPAPQSDSKAA